jgi:hypothetical protein
MTITVSSLAGRRGRWKASQQSAYDVKHSRQSERCDKPRHASRAHYSDDEDAPTKYGRSAARQVPPPPCNNASQNESETEKANLNCRRLGEGIGQALADRDHHANKHEERTNDTRAPSADARRID